MEYNIYTLSDPITNIVMYIGKTKESSNRLKRHLYKSNLKKKGYENTNKNKWILELLDINEVPIMEVLDIGDENNINDLEIYWIGQFKQWGFNLKNMTSGGDGFNWTGKNHKESSIDKIKLNHPFRKSVVQMDKDGNIISRYVSIKEASRETGFYSGHISNCCKNKKSYNTVGGYIFRYDDNLKVDKNKPSSKKYKSMNSKKTNMEVTQYDLKLGLSFGL